MGSASQAAVALRPSTSNCSRRQGPVRFPAVCHVGRGLAGFRRRLVMAAPLALTLQMLAASINWQEFQFLPPDPPLRPPRPLSPPPRPLFEPLAGFRSSLREPGASRVSSRSPRATPICLADFTSRCCHSSSPPARLRDCLVRGHKRPRHAAPGEAAGGYAAGGGLRAWATARLTSRQAGGREGD